MANATIEWVTAQFKGLAARVSEVFATKSETYTKDEVDELITNAGVSALAFDTKEALDTWLEDADNVEKLKVGQNIYIKALDTPDYWWDGTGLQPLEAEKVDLDGYVTDTELETTLADYVKNNTDEEIEDIDFSEFFKEDNA